jgi:hypothetical protein
MQRVHADLRWFHVRRRSLHERMANRTRDRQPLLPALSRHVNDHWHRLRTLLEAARNVDLGEKFAAPRSPCALEDRDEHALADRDRFGQLPRRLVRGLPEQAPPGTEEDRERHEVERVDEVVFE